jgi:hypothetical protein
MSVEHDEHRTTAPRLRLGLASAVCVSLLLSGGVLTALADDSASAGWSGSAPGPLLVPLFALLYFAGHRYSVDIELRKETHSLTLVQVPLALGVMFLAPWLHLVARLTPPLLLAVRQRQPPLKALFNLSSTAFEVGAAAFVVGQVEPTPGPALWLALYCGLLLGDVVGALALSAVWWLIGMPVTRDSVTRALLVGAPVTLLFTAVSIVALSAVRADATMWVVLLALAGMLAVAYRAYQRVVGQQQATQKLYDFVKDLGPLDLTSPAAPAALERMRVLLHAQRLDLALMHAGSWCHLVALEDSPPTRVVSPSPSAAVPRAALHGPGPRQSLGRRRGHHGDPAAGRARSSPAC